MKILSWGVLCLSLICFYTPVLLAQANLVPNSSFEIISSCPHGTNEIEKAPPWYSPRNEYNDEYLDGGLCNRCAPLGTPGNVPFPALDFDYQETVSGDGYSGMVLNSAVPENMLRNYIGTPLLDTLQAGRYYFVSWYVNNEDNKEYGSNNMSMLLTDTPITRSYEGGGYILANAQITAYGNPVIADTQHWVQVASVYQAQGGESALMIGDFTDDTNRDTIRIRDEEFGVSSYSIDDVSITPLDSLPRILIAGPDTSVILGNSVKIGTLINGLPGMLWWDASGALISTGPPQVSVSPVVNTWYRAEVIVGGITYRDTVNVTVLFPNDVNLTQTTAGIFISPNPTTGPVQVSFPKDFGDWDASITDAQGSVVLATQRAKKQLVDISLKVAPGLYFVQLRNRKTGRMITEKLMIKP